MKRIRTITFHRSHNLGAVLQAYALAKYLSLYSEDVLIIDYQPRRVDWANRGILIGGGLKPFLRGLMRFKKPVKMLSKYRSYQNFIEDHLPLTEVVRNIEGLREIDFSDCDLVAGSDQIWNGERGFKEAFFLKFGGTNSKRISYAASFGISALTEEREAELTPLIEGFDSLSTRERSGKKILQKVTAQEVQVVLDPTLLISRESWEKVECPVAVEEEFILFYCTEFTTLFKTMLEAVKNEFQLPIVAVGAVAEALVGLVDRNFTHAGPGQFLYLIRSARIVVTNSFHGTAFSVNFGKALVCIAHTKRNDRMADLLAGVGQADHQVRGFDDVDEAIKRAENIGDAATACNLVQLRGDSQKFIENSLELS